MLGKILIIDQITTNRIALRAKLGASQFMVAQAGTLAETLDELGRAQHDLIICDYDLPDGTAMDLLKQARGFDSRVHPPIIVLSRALPTATRLALLGNGARDVIEKSSDNLLFLARIRSHMRAIHSDAEWVVRDDTTRALGLTEIPDTLHTCDAVRIVGDNRPALKQLAKDLSDTMHSAQFSVAPVDEFLPDDPDAAADAFVLYLTSTHVADVMRLLSTLRCHPTLRHAIVIIVQDDAETEIAAYAFDMGANDLVTRDTDVREIALRLRTQLDRKHDRDHVRDNVRNGLEAAICDPLTGLYNRRYAMPHLAKSLDRATVTQTSVAVLIADLDHFKRVNDTHGHAAGDHVLVETATRLRNCLRSVDLVARIGGEEFLIVLPGATLESAHDIAQRICGKIYNDPFVLPMTRQTVLASISIGMTVYDPRTVGAIVPTPQELIERADVALYHAKEKGRNRVLMAKPAA